MWEYRAKILEVVDGDTLDLHIDLGLGIEMKGKESRVRLKGINTSETYGVSTDSEEYKEGQKHKEFTKAWARSGEGQEWPFLVRTFKNDEQGKFGRWLAEIVRREDGAVLNEDLKEEFGKEVEA